MAEKQKSAGGAWVRKDKSGKTYMSVTIDDKKYVMFKNDYKKEDKHPDYKLYLSKPRAEAEADVPF